MTEEQHKADIAQLIDLPAFRRFLWRSIQMAGIFSPAINGADGRDLSEGRRRLGFDILQDVERAMPDPHPFGLSTLIQVILEESRSSSTQEKPSGRRSRYDDDSDTDSDD